VGIAVKSDAEDEPSRVCLHRSLVMPVSTPRVPPACQRSRRRWPSPPDSRRLANAWRTGPCDGRAIDRREGARRNACGH